MDNFAKKISNVFLWIMNIALIVMGIILSFSLLIETKEIVIQTMKFLNGDGNYQSLIEEIVIFFLYFEFIALIVKYFKNNYHFPLRYFIYIGITAIVRLIIVEHNEPESVLIWAGAILLLIISLAIAEKFIRND
ncbi:phosphate-starvation-inducible protein PsiE [Gemella cuniculi]|uniref:phosphate-starvation-inducible protein PsiE n=1 Tax=Gemella cuniculi TaxID=150240 RepID=UPI00041C6303|nr:phosphate-starvation-inducible protein PsiE [Gemella cuniculi]